MKINSVLAYLGRSNCLLIFLTRLFAKIKTPKRARSSKLSTSEVKKADLNSSHDQVKPGRGAIPRSIQREIFIRDKCCQYQSKVTGHKCASTWNLTLDQIKPVWAGGANSADNLRVFCASHNAEVYRNQAGIRYV